MIAVATNSQPAWSLDHLPINWFDFALVAVLAFGLYRGRKNGMSKEFLPLLEWLLAVGLATFLYAMVADTFINVGGLKRIAGTFVLAYLAIVGLVFFIFYFIKHSLKPKVGGTSFFGGAEYYLGMISGLLRYGCIVTLFLALLNAPIYTPSELAAKQAYNKKNYGGGLYDGNYFPSIPTIQHGVFVESFLGHCIKQNCEVLLIQTENNGGVNTVKKTQVKTQ